MVPRKAAKLQVKKITKTTFVIYSHKTGSSYNQNYFTEKCAQIGRLNEVVLILERETTLFFLQKKKSAKGNRIFPGKWRGDRVLVLQYFDSPMQIIICFDFGYLQGEMWVGEGGCLGVKDRPEVQTLGTSCFSKNLNFSETFKTPFFSW